MFLPVLMLREFGMGAFALFALPNVLGAAAMAWVLAHPRDSAALVERHRAACQAFSLVTILFHLYFAGWMIHLLAGLWPAIATVLLAGVIWWVGHLPRPGRRIDLPVAVGVFICSVLLLLMWVLFVHPMMAPRAVEPLRLMWLAPVVGFGFILCPYLDLTFHRARQATSPAQGQWAFAVGFGGVFLLMILFTLLYAPWLIQVLNGQEPPHGWGGVIGFHLLVQSAFTIAIHVRELSPAQPAALQWPGRLRLVLGVLGAVLLVLIVPTLVRLNPPDGGERIYLYFMACYGLIFPAYVWLCMVPGLDGQTGATRAKVWTLGSVVIVASPMYYMGFIQLQTIWLLPALLIVLLARWVVPMLERSSSGRRG
jgi:hypothetical protein